MDATLKPVQDLFPETRNPEDTRLINGRCLVRIRDGFTLVLVSGIAVAQFASGDRMAEAHAMVMLVEQGLAQQTEVAEAFNCSARTVRRCQRRFENGGLAALGHAEGYPPGRGRLGETRRRLVDRLKSEGVGQREIARRIGVTEKAVRKLLRRSGWKSSGPSQRELPLPTGEAGHPNLSGSVPEARGPSPALGVRGADPNLSAFVAAAQVGRPASHDTNPSDRASDRLLARLGLLQDAPPLFGSAASVPRAGVLAAAQTCRFCGGLNVRGDFGIRARKWRQVFACRL